MHRRCGYIEEFRFGREVAQNVAEEYVAACSVSLLSGTAAFLERHFSPNSGQLATLYDRLTLVKSGERSPFSANHSCSVRGREGVRMASDAGVHQLGADTGGARNFLSINLLLGRMVGCFLLFSVAFCIHGYRAMSTI